MKMRFNKQRPIVLFLIVILSLFFGYHRLFSEYLIEEEEEEGVKEVIRVERKKSGVLPVYVAYSIKAEKVPYIEDGIRVKWSYNPKYKGDFMVGRSNQIIDSQERALTARTIRIIKANGRGMVIDTGLSPGKYYYVVVAKEKIKARDVELYRDLNFTSFPVVIDEPEIEATTSLINAKKIGRNRAWITWSKVKTRRTNYVIYRSSSIINTKSVLNHAQKIAVVSDKEDFLDENVKTSGIYYYAVILDDFRGNAKYELKADENYTTSGVRLEGKPDIRPAFRVSQIKAVVSGRDVIIKWGYSGISGSRYFRFFRSSRPLKSSTEIKEDYFLDEVDITAGSYRDKTPPRGLFYYGLIPYKDETSKETALISGKNITSAAKGIKTLYIKKRVHREQIPDKQDYEYSDIDSILKRTFYQGNFQSAIKELQKLIRKSDNDISIAKAKLFIGKSYIETGQHRKAVDYFVLDDVTRHFPSESRFWREFAIKHVK